MSEAVIGILFAFVGGVGLFLFGLRFMSDGLQTLAGDRMRTILEKGTRNPVRGVFTGMAVTALIQSSSATTVLVVGLVNAELLTLRQAIGVVMGANIGTTLTVYIIGFNLAAYALPILGVGALIHLFSKTKKNQVIGQTLLGFGILFFGMAVMGDGVKPLKDLDFFTSLMTSIDNNSLVGVGIGVLMTGIIQSSAATIGVMQQLSYQGAMTYHQAVPILFGDNIGTTVTALLSGIGTSVAARRTALTHTMFNLMGTMIFLPLFLVGFFEKMVIWFTNYLFVFLPGSTGTWEALNIKLQIAQTHAVFNISNTIIQLPFVAVLAYVVTRLIPDKPAIEDPYRPKFIDRRFLNNPSVALAQAKREMLHMASMAGEAFSHAIDYFNDRQEASMEKVHILEDAIDRLEREITDYVVLISRKQLSKAESTTVNVILQSLNDIERIGDHCENIIEQGVYAEKNQVSFSGEAQEEMKNFIEITTKALQLAYQALEYDDKSVAKEVLPLEGKLDELMEIYRKAHIRRLNEGKCNGSNGAVFLDMLTNLERISDHCRNIAGYIMEEVT